MAPSALRLHALDHLRAFVMLTVILQHAAMPYFAGLDRWHVHDDSRSLGFNILMGICDGFGCHLFFLLAGFFGHLLWLKLGLWGFLRQRLVRVGLPFLLGMLTVVPLCNWLWRWAKGLPTSSADWLLLFRAPGHLWFLEVLLLFYAAAAGLLWVGQKTGASRCVAPLDVAVDWLMASPWRLWVLLLPAMLCMWPNADVGQIHDKGQNLFPPLRALLYYGLFFGLGWGLHRRPDRLRTLAQNYAKYLSLSVVSFPVFGLGFMAYAAPGSAHPLWLKAVVVLASCLYAWATVFAVTGWFLRYADSRSPRVGYLADASYWCYVVHFPLLLWLRVVTLRWPLNCGAKFAFVVLVTLAVCLALYAACVRHTWLGRLLNGPLKQPGAGETAAAAAGSAAESK